MPKRDTSLYTHNSKCSGLTRLVHLWNGWSCGMSMLSPESHTALVQAERQEKRWEIRKVKTESVSQFLLHSTLKWAQVFWCWTRVFLVGLEICNSPRKSFTFSHISEQPLLSDSSFNSWVKRLQLRESQLSVSVIVSLNFKPSVQCSFHRKRCLTMKYRQRWKGDKGVWIRLQRNNAAN